MVLEIHMKLCVTEQDFPEKNFCPKNWGNGPKMGSCVINGIMCHNPDTWHNFSQVKLTSEESRQRRNCKTKY